MVRTTEKACVSLAVFAVADMGGKIYLTPGEAKRFEGYALRVSQAIITDMHEAWAASAYVIERANGGCWRLCRFCKGSGQADVSPLFLTRTAFADAMRTVSAMAGMR